MMARTDGDGKNEIRITKVPSLLRRVNLPQTIHITHEMPFVEEGVVAVQVLSTTGKRTDMETVTGEDDHLVEGDVIPAVLGKRRKFNGRSCDVPDTLAAGDMLHWSSSSGVVGKIRGGDRSWGGEQLPVRVLGGLQISGKPLSIKQTGEKAIPRRRLLDETVAAAPVICVAGTATNTGKTSTAAKIIQYYKDGGHKVPCAKMTGMSSVAELGKLSSPPGADLVQGFMDAGLPSTCGDATEVVEVALGILHRLNEMRPDVVVVEFGSSFLGLYNAEGIFHSADFRARIAAVVVSATDPVSAGGAKQILGGWGIEITAFTGPVVISPSFAEYVGSACGG
ncbi:hypothetical protein ED733_002550 [Metarhizium rileyi]|uniref:DUF1611 domain-containing protein n=1 Tax=Metarhizium rileyi (strain RCEF 4871) TaxID=1649241 RepID=A0A5C6G9L9_METRR|nr:hypothetical protein ED733_002550 [Metarhizium rileyi]